jgi:hypothetical protein
MVRSEFKISKHIVTTCDGLRQVASVASKLTNSMDVEPKEHPSFFRTCSLDILA